jgi:16S rRNA (cytidine1402-2'-O)-methyltransferase
MAREEQPDDKPLAPGLYLVATPIGNLEDITLRALRVLRNADRIACEDTRQTQKLLNHFQIATSTVSYHQHNEIARTGQLIADLKAGARIAVVSDAGTPGISDPGAEIAAAAIAAGIPVIPIPGANAALAALIASGLLAPDSSRNENSAAFIFHGFLPAKEGQRRTALENLKNSVIPNQTWVPQVPRTRAPGEESPNAEPENRTVILSGAISLQRDRAVEGPAVPSTEAQVLWVSNPKSATESPIHIFYEAPHRILATLADIEAVFGPAQHLVLARELTKLHEEFLRGHVSDLRKTLSDRPTIRGEFVLLFTPASISQTTSAESSSAQTQLSLAQEVRALMQSENLSEMDALKRVARARGLSKSAAYRELQRSRGK